MVLVSHELRVNLLRELLAEIGDHFARHLVKRGQVLSLLSAPGRVVDQVPERVDVVGEESGLLVDAVVFDVFRKNTHRRRPGRQPGA